MTLATHFANYRARTAASIPYSDRKHCSVCKLPKSPIGGRLIPREGSSKKAWVCAGCKP